MNKTDLNEAVAATQTVLLALLGTLAGQTGTAGAQLALAVNAMSANAAIELPSGAPFWSDLANCFDQARLAGATFAAMDKVRATAQALIPAGKPAIAVQNFAVRMALAEQGQILAATTFTSRQQIDGFFDLINASFETAILVAADNGDNVAYEALIALQGAIANDLGSRARPLPRLVSYSFPQRMPSLWLAQRLYQDPSRTDQLVGENRPVHPAFMPATGTALSA
jgi:prophage DNA circulation protein